MKPNQLKLSSAGAACAAMLALPAVAGDRQAGLYLTAEAGPTWSQDLDVKVGGLSGKAELEIGAHFGVGIGYQINRYVGVEFDTGFTYNQFKDSDDSLSHVPLMANAVFCYKNRTKFEPYVGVGAGGSYSTLAFNESFYGPDEWDGDFVFAWQAIAGLRYNFNKQMSVGVGYKFLEVAETDFGIDGLNYRMGKSRNHSVNFVFNMRF